MDHFFIGGESTDSSRSQKGQQKRKDRGSTQSPGRGVAAEGDIRDLSWTLTKSNNPRLRVREQLYEASIRPWEYCSHGLAITRPKLLTSLIAGDALMLGS